MLAGCATYKPPQISFDANVPPLPAIPRPSRRPARPIHIPPAWTVARGGQIASTATGRVENANAAARVQPRREGYYNASRFIRGRKARSIRSMPRPARSPTLRLSQARA